MEEIENLKNTLHLGDCLEVMKKIPNESVDLICCDLPYGRTGCKWDVIIPFDKLWKQYKRIIKKKGAIVLNASQPFTSLLIMSNLEMYKYNWVWEKSKASNFMHSKYQPLKAHEDICVFSKYPSAQNSAKKNMNYFPVMIKGQEYIRNNRPINEIGVYSGGNKIPSTSKKGKLRYPKSVIYFKTSEFDSKYKHPTQKPIALLEYLVKTYSNENDIILDNCMGSGTTCLASKNLNRYYIGIEKEEKYFNIAKKRLE